MGSAKTTLVGVAQNMQQRPAVDAIQTPAEPWYRQFWPWFLLALLASVVVASLITVAIAFVHSDNLVVDNYYRQGLAINQQLARDEMASAQNIHATLTLRNDRTITVAIEGDSRPADQHTFLQLLWQHPTASNKDFTSTLPWHSKNLFSTVLKQFPAGRWYITLQPLANSADPQQWRLKREVLIGATPTSTEPTITNDSADNVIATIYSFDLDAR